MNLKPVCFLLSLCHAGFAAAIGLGEISVRSYLGQPLHATVALIGATSATQADCFSLDAGPGGISPPLRAQLSIEKTGAHTLLHIRTPQAIHDPIAQFVLISDCEARLQRDYVVLLDPPVQVEPAILPETPASADNHDAPRAAVVPRVPRRATRVHAAPPVLARPQAAPRQPAARPKQTAPAATKPRLVLSGKESIQANASLPLHPDTAPPDQALPPAKNLTATELSDENTALNRRIEYLEMQLAMLQKRNAELDARRRAAATRVAPPPPEQPPQWPLYLLAIGLLTGGGALAVWLGRRSRKRSAVDISYDKPWAQPDSLPKLPETAPAPEPAPSATRELTSEVDSPAMAESTEVRDDILDQAEVYMAHGRGDVAVRLLQEHLREAPAESPVPWLLLLDLLRRAGDADGYAAASAECRRYFNINTGTHPVAQENGIGSGLEAYPHVLEQMVQKWNTPDIDTFFNDLIYDHRGGTRIGFEPGAYREILLLRTIAQSALPLAA